MLVKKCPKVALKRNSSPIIHRQSDFIHEAAGIISGEGGGGLEVYTVGFTRKTAEQFFGLLKANGIQRLLDVRLNNTSQLASFAKRDDLAYFLRELCGADYVHEPLLAPTQELLDAYKKNGGDWADYETSFLQLMADRAIETKISKKLFEGRTVMLCSEATPEQCHRRLVAEYLNEKWGGLQITHL